MSAPDSTGRESLPAAQSDEGLLACTVSSWQGDAGRCRWCDGELTGRQKRWCSPKCSGDFTRNHMWSSASKAARKRDEFMCVECRIDPREARDLALMEGLRGPLARRFLTLQVHHKDPVLGRHGVFGCHHHLDGLETVCLHHHLARHHELSTGQIAMEDAA